MCNLLFRWYACLFKISPGGKTSFQHQPVNTSQNFTCFNNITSYSSKLQLILTQLALCLFIRHHDHLRNQPTELSVNCFQCKYIPYSFKVRGTEFKGGMWGKFYFTQREVSAWNAQSGAVVEADKIVPFKRLLGTWI